MRQPDVLRKKYKNPRLMLYTTAREMLSLIIDAYDITKSMKTNDSWDLRLK